MNRSRTIGLSMLGWLTVGLFWLVVTRNYHPTWTLATIATSSLVSAYAVAAYVHHRYLIPKYWQADRVAMHVVLLVTAMIFLTGFALAIIRFSYLHAFGPYPVDDWYIDYAIDFFGMAVHLVMAVVVVALCKRYAL